MGPAKLRLSALHAANFLEVGVYLPFFPVWLESRGLDAPVIGLILAIPIVIRIAVTAPLMRLADGRLGPRVLLVASHGTLILAFPCLLVARDPAAVAALVAVVALAQAPIIPASDLVTTQAVRADPRLDYGRIRLWGSVAFLGAGIGAGYLVGSTTADVIVLLLSALPAAGLLAALAAVPAAQVPAGAGTGAVGLPAPSGLPRGLWLVMGAAACTQASHAALYGFGSIHWREQGFSGSDIGYLWAAGVVAEIVLFAALGRTVGRTAGAFRLVMAGSTAAVVRFALMATEPGLPATFALQALHGLTFGATHLGAVAAVTALAPEGSRGWAQGALSAMLALASAAATVASGVAFRAGGALAFAAVAPLGALGFVLALSAVRSVSSQPQRAGEGG